MTNAEAVWSLAMLGILLVGAVIFIRVRRRMQDFTEGRTFKVRLPLWVAIVERFNWYALTLVFGAAAFRAFSVAHEVARPRHRIEGADAVYAVTGVALIALPIAMICANGISWIVPPLRRANRNAMSGLEVSFAKLTRGLLLFGAVSIPLGLIDLAISATEPWAR